MLCYALYISPGSICLRVGKDLGMYVHGVVPAGRFLIMSHFFTIIGFPFFLESLLVYAVPGSPPPFSVTPNVPAGRKLGQYLDLIRLFPFWAGGLSVSCCLLPESENSCSMYFVQLSGCFWQKGDCGPCSTSRTRRGSIEKYNSSRYCRCFRSRLYEAGTRSHRK